MENPLVTAARSGDEQLLLALIHGSDNEADIDTFDDTGDTPLTAAIRANHVGILKRLLGRNADVNANDSEGRTPIILATELGDRAMVEFLLGRNADYRLRSRIGLDPLAVAQAFGFSEIVRLIEDRRLENNERIVKLRRLLRGSPTGSLRAEVLAVLERDVLLYPSAGAMPVSHLIKVYGLRAKVNQDNGEPIRGFPDLIHGLATCYVDEAVIHSVYLNGANILIFTSQNINQLIGVLWIPLADKATYRTNLRKIMGA